MGHDCRIGRRRRRAALRPAGGWMPGKEDARREPKTSGSFRLSGYASVASSRDQAKYRPAEGVQGQGAVQRGDLCLRWYASSTRRRCLLRSDRSTGSSHRPGRPTELGPSSGQHRKVVREPRTTSPLAENYHLLQRHKRESSDLSSLTAEGYIDFSAPSSPPVRRPTTSPRASAALAHSASKHAGSTSAASLWPTPRPRMEGQRSDIGLDHVHARGSRDAERGRGRRASF